MRILHRAVLATGAAAAVSAATVAVLQDPLAVSYAATLAQPAQVVHVAGVQARGPAASCNGDVCGLGASDPVSVNAAGTRAYAVTITASFQYRTVGPGPFAVAATLRTDNGRDLYVRPSRRLVLPTAARRQSATVQFRAARLTPGTDYAVRLSALILRHGRSLTSIVVERLLISVDGWSA